MIASTTQIDQPCFQFKASFLPCTVLQLMRNDIEDLEKQLELTVRRAPNLFMGSPVIIDLEKVKTFADINLSHIKKILMTNGLIPIGIRGGSEEQLNAAIREGWSILTPSKVMPQDFNKKKKEESSYPKNKIVTSPIRSGMQVYAKEGDLIVTAAVSAGAELFADGNIHVYGPLRGRALAGVQGDMQARIFCRSLEAELVSIAGYYLTKEDMQTTYSKEGIVQVYLEKAQVRIETI